MFLRIIFINSLSYIRFFMIIYYLFIKSLLNFNIYLVYLYYLFMFIGLSLLNFNKNHVFIWLLQIGSFTFLRFQG